MCYVIVTCRSLIWTVLSLVAVVAVFSAIITPTWLEGPTRIINTDNGTEEFTPSIGIYNRCIWTNSHKQCSNFTAEGFATPNTVFPLVWKMSLIMMLNGLGIMAVTVLVALIGCCLQSCCGKSIFDLAGVAQAVAGLVYLIGMVLYPAGWGNDKVKKMCGKDADIFSPGDCAFGWASYCAAFGIALTFVCAMFSGQVEKSTASDKVQDKLNEGKTFIILA